MRPNCNNVQIEALFTNKHNFRDKKQATTAAEINKSQNGQISLAYKSHYLHVLAV